MNNKQTIIKIQYQILVTNVVMLYLHCNCNPSSLFYKLHMIHQCVHMFHCSLGNIETHSFYHICRRRTLNNKKKKYHGKKTKMTLMWWCKFLTIVTMFSNKTVLTTVRTNPINMVTLFVVYTMTSAELSTIHPKVTGSTCWFKWNAICIIYKDYMY